MNTLEIRQEIKLLKSSAISVLGQDKEGKYHPNLLKKLSNQQTKNQFTLLKTKKGF
ncbi:hypothetical protein L6261_03385 [Candidatus Parcubacteria bacterium]|nr:hypothetical protein [Candidatus Parcubacteria bacterium]